MEKLKRSKEVPASSIHEIEATLLSTTISVAPQSGDLESGQSKVTVRVAQQTAHLEVEASKGLRVEEPDPLPPQSLKEQTSFFIKDVRKALKPLRTKLNNKYVEPRLENPLLILKASTLSQEVRKYALFSKMAYNPVRDAYMLKEAVLEGYELSPSLSDRKSIVAVNRKKKSAIIAFRGTASKRDALPDLAIAVGIETHLPLLEKKLHERHKESSSPSQEPLSRFLAAEVKYQRVKEEYPDYEISTTGHSLGGTQAEYVSGLFGLSGHSFNPGCSPPGMRISKRSLNNFTTHVVIGDFVSNSKLCLEGQPGLICYHSKYIGKHSINSFIFDTKDEERIHSQNYEEACLSPNSKEI